MDKQQQQYTLCPGCDLLLEIPALSVNKKALCPRCHTRLTEHREKSVFNAISYSLCGLFMLLLAVSYPFVNMRVQGIYSEIYLLQIPQVMLADNYSSLAIIFSTFVIFIPIFCLSSIIALNINAPLPLLPAVRIFMARWLLRCKTWSMGEIFLTGVLVSFVKLMAYGDIGIGLSFLPYCLFSLFQLKAFQTVDPVLLWRKISPPPKLNQPLKIGQTGQAQNLRLCLCCHAIVPQQQSQCPRCGQKSYLRRPQSLNWTLALLITAIMLYLPANILPIMITETLGDPMASTILSGVLYIWQEGSYPVALVIFIASIMIPCLKIVALLWLCYFANKKQVSGTEECQRAMLIYEMVEFVGRWSMIDIFVIGVLASLIRFGLLMGVYPAIGALLFALVVFITMIASIKFDPRLLWDNLNRINRLSK